MVPLGIFISTTNFWIFSTAVSTTAVLVQSIPGEQKLQIQTGCQMEIWIIGLWTVGLFRLLDHLTIAMFNIRWMTAPLTAVPKSLRLSCYNATVLLYL